jgi:hypothetical protein
MYRAMESERPDALFWDPYARRLAGPQGEEILRTMPRAKAFAWPMIVRTAVMDEIIVRAIARDGVQTVVNLAAGLDARPFRLVLPRTLRWIDVDLPAMQDSKREALAAETPRCALEWAPADLAQVAERRAVLARVVPADGGDCVVAETVGDGRESRGRQGSPYPYRPLPSPTASYRLSRRSTVLPPAAAADRPTPSESCRRN